MTLVLLSVVLASCVRQFWCGLSASRKLGIFMHPSWLKHTNFSREVVVACLLYCKLSFGCSWCNPRGYKVSMCYQCVMHFCKLLPSRLHSCTSCGDKMQLLHDSCSLNHILLNSLFVYLTRDTLTLPTCDIMTLFMSGQIVMFLHLTCEMYIL